MSGPRFPDGWILETLDQSHNRRAFSSGQDAVDRWLKKAAFQSQKKHLSTTKVLLGDVGEIVGYYTLATSQVDFSDLPMELAKKLARRNLPISVLGWLGIDQSFQGRGIGSRLLATALLDCYETSRTFAFIAVVLDCIDDQSKAFYERFDFQQLPGYAMRLFISFQQLEAMANTD